MTGAAVFALLRKVPPIVWVVLALLAWGGWHRWQAIRATKAFDEAKVQAQVQRAEAAASAAQLNTRRVNKQKEALDAKDRELAAQRAAAVASADAARQLRASLAALRAGCPAPAPFAAPGSAPARAAEDLHTYVQRRLDEAADGIAEYAGAAAAAGRACERSYDALMER